MSEPLFYCGNEYLGFRDDVPRGCQGCLHLRVMERSAAATYMMPCHQKRDMMLAMNSPKEASDE